MPIGLQFDRLRQAAVLVLILSDFFHAQGAFSAMHHVVIHECGDAVVILHGPALEMVAVGFFEIAIEQLRRGIRLGREKR